MPNNYSYSEASEVPEYGSSGGGRRRGRGGSGRGSYRGRGGYGYGGTKGDRLIGALIKIISGPYKTEIGTVKNVTDDILYIVLYSTGQFISVNRSHVEEVTKQSSSLISSRKIPCQVQIPNLEFDGSKTPLYGSQTPMHNSE